MSKRPINYAEYDYFRRHTGRPAAQCLALVRAEQFGRNANLELQHELGVSYLHQKRLRDVPIEDGPWEDRAWEFSEELVVMPRPKDKTPNRVVAAILAAKLIADSSKPVTF